MGFIGFFHLGLKGSMTNLIIETMKKEQSVTILYTILGCIVGYISLSLNDFLTLFALIIGIYFITVIPLSKKITVDKMTTWLFSNTFIVYFLVWLIVYILLSNVV
jgi:uncharacterized membrane protein (Fun14 family)